MKTGIRRTLLSTTLLFSVAIAASPAYAQEEDGSRTDAEATGAQVPVESGVDTTSAEQPGGEIIVTGSRIARPDLESSSPVTVITGEALEISGTVSVEEYLREIPQAVSAIGENTNNGNPGVATVDLRNLGEERTLVLVDGKRFIPYDSNGVVDLNMIPAALVERVDVLTGGASSVYGSDAIAGVVNFVLRKDFSGFEADAQVGITERGDGFQQAFSVTVGANAGDGRGNLVANATYIKDNAVYQGARDFSRFALSGDTLSAGGGSSTNAQGTVRGLSPALCGGFHPSDVGVCVFAPNGDLVPYNRVTDSFNFNPYNLLQAPQEKWTATTLGRYEITDSIEFFTRASFANTRVSTIIAPSGTFNFPFTVVYGDNPATAAIETANPFLTAQARGVLAASDSTPGDGTTTVPIGRRTVELGTRDSIYENTAYQVVGGFTGDIVPGLGYEIFGQWGRTSRTQTFANDTSFAGVQACIDDGTCNIFGAGNLSLAAGNAIRIDLQQYDSTSQTVAGGFLTYDLPFALGGTKTGGIVGGVEYRRDAGTARPDNNLVTGNSIGFGSSTPIDARIVTKEYYAEAKLPIFDIASVEAGYRVANNKNRDNLTGLGNEFTARSYKFGADFEPIPDIRFRAVYQRAVRAPNLNEIGQPLTPSTGDAGTDPCQSSQITPAMYAAAAPGSLAALCLATGVPLANGLAGNISGPISGQINNYVGGNIGLTPEKATTKTVGVVLQPRFVPGFTAAIDYFDIVVKNAIIAPPEEETLKLCYEQELDPNGFFCQRVIRNPLDGSLIGGTETGVVSTNINAGLLQTRGIDFSIAYRTPKLMDDLRFALALNATRTLRTRFQTTVDSDINECVGLVGKTCLRGLPKWQWNQTTTAFWGPVTVQLRWRHIGKLTQDAIVLGNDPQPASNFGRPVIKAHNYFDLFTKFDIGDHYEFRFGINNLFDKQPPIVGQDYAGTAEGSGNTIPATYDPMGRAFFAGVNLRF